MLRFGERKELGKSDAGLDFLPSSKGAFWRP